MRRGLLLELLRSLPLVAGMAVIGRRTRAGRRVCGGWWGVEGGATARVRVEDGAFAYCAPPGLGLSLVFDFTG